MILSNHPYCLIGDRKTFAFSAENPTGTRAGGSRGGDCISVAYWYQPIPSPPLRPLPNDKDMSLK